MRKEIKGRYSVPGIHYKYICYNALCVNPVSRFRKNPTPPITSPGAARLAAPNATLISL